MNLRYWHCPACQAIIRYTVVSNQPGHCHAEAGRLVTIHFRTYHVWQRIIAAFYPKAVAFVAQGLMHNRIEHSWVEIGDHAFDTNYGAIVDRKSYYQLYEVTAIRRFTARQFTEQLVTHNEYRYFGLDCPPPS